METAGKFKIKYSFKITGKGLIVVGDIIEGRVNIGSFITFDTGSNRVKMKISDVGMGHGFPESEALIALGFVYRDEVERKEFEYLQLNEQMAEISTG